MNPNDALDSVAESIRLHFRANGLLEARLGQNFSNPDTGEILREFAFIQIDDLGMVYLHPYKREFFWDGLISEDFPKYMHFRLKLGFRHILPLVLRRLLLDTWHEKTPKSLVFSEESENQIYMP